MNYLRHPNGRGKLFDDAEVNRATYIDRTSSARDFAKLRDCRLVEGSRAEDRCQIYGGRYLSSVISGQTICAGDPRVFRSMLRCSEVSGSPQIWNSDLLGTTEICDTPKLNGIIAQDAIIYGSPEIAGTFTVTGRIHEGVWFRPPKHISLPWCDLSECVDGKMLLNCYCRKAEWFIRFGHRLAAKWNWSPEQVEVTMDTIRREFLTTNLQSVITCGNESLPTTTPPEASTALP